LSAKRKHHADILLVIALFAVYAICAIMLTALGAGVYRNITAIMIDNYDTRTGILYVAEKVRQYEVSGAVRIDKLDGGDALVLVEPGTGGEYETWIYIANGQLCEQMIAKGEKIDIDSSQVIMPMQAMQLNLSKARLLTVEMTTISDVSTAISLNLRVGDS
jgi:hypothetical protein